jgi:hypothetical protein
VSNRRHDGYLASIASAISSYGSPATPVVDVNVVNPISVTFPSSIAVTQDTSPWVVEDTAAEASLAAIESSLASVIAPYGSPATPVVQVEVVNPTESTNVPYSSDPETPFAVTVDQTSIFVLAANAARKGLTIQNVSCHVISFAFNSAAVLLGAMTLYPGGSFWMDSYDFSTGAVYAIASANDSNLVVQEFE